MMVDGFIKFYSFNMVPQELELLAMNLFLNGQSIFSGVFVCVVLGMTLSVRSEETVCVTHLLLPSKK